MQDPDVERRARPLVIGPLQVPLLSQHRAHVIDIRPLAEWQRCRIEGSIPIPHPGLRFVAPGIGRERMLIVVSDDGCTAKAEASWLTEEGFVAAAIRGGVRAWRAAGITLLEG